MPDDPHEEVADDALERGELPEGEVQSQTSEVRPNPPTVHILVNRPEDSNGQVTVDVYGTGDLRVTEIETIIKLGLNKWQQQAGLG